MGCDIHGMVEAVPQDPDRHYIRYLCPIAGVVSRSYDSFGCLFGVRNSVGFNPLFDGRGLPDEFSITGKDRVEDSGDVGSIIFHHPTYFTYSELSEVDWSEQTERLDSRLAVVDEDGNTQMKGSYISSIHDNLTEDEKERLEDGERIELSDTNGAARYAVHKTPTRKEALSGAWQWFLFELLPTYKDRYESHDIRVTVWFDN